MKELIIRKLSIPELSVHFFSRFESKNKKRLGFYDQLIEIVEKIDKLGFHAVWYPERHFDEFGGPYPSPAVLGAATAVKTSSIRIRAGSVVIPLCNPIRVAEEWAMIDLLSNGRVDLAIAQGWNPRDFAIAPNNYKNRFEITLDGIRKIQSLWGGEKLDVKDGNGMDHRISLLPAPVQSELSIWMTCSMGNHDRFYDVGKMGLNVLTALLFQNDAELASNIKAYHEGRKTSGLDPETGLVTLMQHTYVGSSEAETKATAWQPLTEYLRSSLSLWRGRFEQFEDLEEDELDLLFDFAVNKYYQSSGVFGDENQVIARLQYLKSVGVTEVSCLMDFGIEHPKVLHSIERLGRILKEKTNAT
ncbi:MAG: LLM class flavin-dependent oxidoreductase [Rhizobiales bacterium]|nr:LLM class flavin-dependent oxidoreductase [Hyphomicrobiales bacterium]